MKEREHFLLAVDLCDFKEYEIFFNNIFSSFGPLDGLVHFAGISALVPLKVMKLKKLQEILNINLLAFFELTKYFSKDKYFNKLGASIIGASSVSSLRGAPALSGYSCSKAALDGAVRSLACELATKKIRINSIAPGIVNSKMNQKILKTKKNIVSKKEILRLKKFLKISEKTIDKVYLLIKFLNSSKGKKISGKMISSMWDKPTHWDTKTINKIISNDYLTMRRKEL